MQDHSEARPRRLIREVDLDERGIMSRSNRWRGVRNGTFPAPVVIGPNSKAWYEDEIDAWLASRPRRTYGGPTTEAMQGAQQPISTTAQITAALAAPEAQRPTPTAPEITEAPVVPKRSPNGKAKAKGHRASKAKSEAT
jgi:prophage regulatory protein